MENKVKVLAGLLLLIFLITSCKTQNSKKEEGYIRVSSKNPYYFTYDNGDPYIPVGMNMCFERFEKDEKKVFDLYEERFRKLSDNGGNFVRIWLSHPFFEIEHTKPFEYDERATQRIDYILRLAKKYGIKVKFCVEHFRKLTGGGFFEKAIYFKENGGPLSSMTEYLQSPIGKDLYMGKIRYLANRYRNNPSIFGWELWNEISAVNSRFDITLQWTLEITPAVKSELPNHLIMSTLGSFDAKSKRKKYNDFMTFQENEVAEVHRYLDMGAKWDICQAPIDTLASTAVCELRKMVSVKPKPILLAETGAVEPRHTGPSRLYEIDTTGIILHDILFAPFFSGSAGTGQSWHWQVYIEKNNLWWHFQRFSEVITGYNPIEENPVPTEFNQGDFRVYTLNGKNTILIWVRDIHSNWETELVEKKGAPVYEGAMIDVGSLKIAKNTTVSVYDPWENVWTKNEINNSKVSLPDFSRSLVIKIEK